VFIPVGTDRSLNRPTRVVYALIAVNVIVFVMGKIWSSPKVDPEGWERIWVTLMLHPTDFHWWGLFGYQFLHANAWHIGFNMLFLFVFGPNVEDRFGRLGFLAFYLAAGAVAGGAHALLEFNPVIGASGAVAGVTGAYLVLFPKTTIRLFVVFFVIGSFQIPATWFIGFAIARDLFMAFGTTGQNVAFFAHLGGYAFGIAVSLFLLATKLLSREPYDLFSLGRQAHRRRQFRELTSRGSTPWNSELSTGSRVRKPQLKTKTRSRPAADPDAGDPHAAKRAELNQHLSAGRNEEAVRAYLEMMKTSGKVMLSRDSHYAIGAHLFSMGRHEDAAEAFEAFLGRWPRDREGDHVRLLLALGGARYLNDPVRAGRLLTEIRTEALPESERKLARELESEIG